MRILISIDILIRFAPYVDELIKIKINDSLEKAYNWVLMNQVDDGGFVFRLNESMLYGHEQMKVILNKEAMFPTWFRTLSLAYIGKVLPNSMVGKFDWQILKCPGHQFDCLGQHTRPIQYCR